MFYFEAVALLNDLNNFHDERDAKYPTFLHFLELEVPKGTGNKASFQTLTIQELFLNYMNVFSVERSKNHRSDMDSTVERRHKKIFNRVCAHVFSSSSVQ